MSNENRRFNVAVVGATGAVGETMLSILAERNFPVATLYALASSRSAGGQVEFNGGKVDVLTWPSSTPPAWTSRCSPPAAACPRNTAPSSPRPVRW